MHNLRKKELRIRSKSSNRLPPVEPHYYKDSSIKPDEKDQRDYKALFRSYLQEESDHADSTDRAYQKLYSVLRIDETVAILKYMSETLTSVSEEEARQCDAYKQLSTISSMTKLVGQLIQWSEKKARLKRMTATQNAITYLLFIIFIINAFITGFGLA